MNIYTNLLQLAIDEGKDTAMARAQELQLALTTIMEIGDEEERAAMAHPLYSIEHAIRDIVNHYSQLPTLVAEASAR